MASRRGSKSSIQGAIKRPGALTRHKRRGESTGAAARRLKKSGSPLQKRQANFYLNVLAPAGKKSSGGKKSSSSRGTHRVKAHTRPVGSKRVRVKAYRRPNPR